MKLFPSSLILAASLTASTLAQICEDSSTFTFEAYDQFNNYNEVTCDWFKENPDRVDIRKANRCDENDIFTNCQESCGRCDSLGGYICKDNEFYSFEVFDKNGGIIDVGCDWLVQPGITEQQLTNRYNKHCGGEVGTHCQKSCGFCGDSTCTGDLPNFTFVVYANDQGDTRSVECSWINEPKITLQQKANRVKKWCYDDDVGPKCCDTCIKAQNLDTKAPTKPPTTPTKPPTTTKTKSPKKNNDATKAPATKAPATKAPATKAPKASKKTSSVISALVDSSGDRSKVTLFIAPIAVTVLLALMV